MCTMARITGLEEYDNPCHHSNTKTFVLVMLYPAMVNLNTRTHLAGFIGLCQVPMEKKIENFCDSLTLVECNHFQVWAIRKTYETSGRPLNTIKVIAVDGKLSEEYLRAQIPGKYPNLTRCMQISQSHFISFHFARTLS